MRKAEPNLRMVRRVMGLPKEHARGIDRILHFRPGQSVSPNLLSLRLQPSSVTAECWTQVKTTGEKFKGIPLSLGK
jgi:hypothetical protein